jgi:bleomycin hydrolase
MNNCARNIKDLVAILLFVFTITALNLPGHAAQATSLCEATFADESGGRGQSIVSSKLSVSAPAELPGTVTEKTYGTLKSSFQHDPHYSKEVEFQSDIKDQCGLGTCHLYSWASDLEQHYASTHKKPLKISTRYLAARHWLVRSLQELQEDRPPADANGDRPAESLDVGLGATTLMSRELIKLYGIMPEEAFPMADDFQSQPISDRVESFVSTIIGRARWDRELAKTAKKKAKITEVASAQIRGIFANLIGPFPKTFNFEGKTYTPQSFAAKNFPELNSPILTVLINKRPTDKTRLITSPATTYLMTSSDEVERMARELLDQGKNVYLSIEANRTFMDRSTGIMSIDAFNVPPGSEPLTREQRSEFGFRSGGHAVQIVGYDLDPATGLVRKWKIKNSWGTDVGDHGYYHMYRDYFREFANGISFYADSGVVLPKADITEEMRTSVQLPIPDARNYGPL